MLDDEKFAKAAARLDLDVPALRNTEESVRVAYLQQVVFQLNKLSQTHHEAEQALLLIGAYQGLIESRSEASVDEALFDRYFLAALAGACNGPFAPNDEVIRGAAQTAQIAIEVRHEVLNGNRA